MALNRASPILFGSGLSLDVAFKLRIAKEDPVSANPLENTTKFHSLVLKSPRFSA
jgi:hypothetical protein